MFRGVGKRGVKEINSESWKAFIKIERTTMAFNEFYHSKFNPNCKKRWNSLIIVRLSSESKDDSVLLVCMWRHGGHVGQWSRTKAFLYLGTKLYFHVNSSRKYVEYCIDIKHGRLVTWLQAKNIVYLFRRENYNLPIVNISFFLFIDSWHPPENQHSLFCIYRAV